MTGARRFAAAAALVVAGTVAGLLAAEALVRLFPSSISEVTRGRMQVTDLVINQEPVSVADPYLGFVYPPRVSKTLSRGDFSFTYTTDGNGFRNRWPWPERPNVVAIGDSFTFGYGVGAEQSWVARLDDELGGGQIVNLGLIGAAPQQYVRAYERYGAGLHPRVVLLGLNPEGDLIDVDLFDGWERAGGPGSYDEWRFFEGRVPSPRSGLSRLKEKSYLYWLITDVRGRLRRPDIYRGQTITIPGGARIPLALGYLDRLRDRARPDSAQFQRVIEIIGSARSIVETSGAELVVVLMPSRERVYAPIAGIDAVDVVGAFRNALEQRGVRVLDLTPALEARAAEGEILYFTEDGHWNETGNARVADTVARYLEGLFELGLSSEEPAAGPQGPA